MKIFQKIVIVVVVLWFVGVVYVVDLLMFKFEMMDGKLMFVCIEVLVGQCFKIEIRNIGKGVVEFESVQLCKEKVFVLGVDLFVVVVLLLLGEYKFFDDFYQQVQGVIVVK